MPASNFVFGGTVILAAITVLTDYCLKRAGQEQQSLNLWFAVAVMVYIFSAFGWVYVFRHLSFAEVGVIYSVSVMLMLAFTGVCFFKETLKAAECAGIALAIASILLLKRFA